MSGLFVDLIFKVGTHLICIEFEKKIVCYEAKLNYKNELHMRVLKMSVANRHQMNLFDLLGCAS